MIVDTSAIIAIMRGEADGDDLLRQLIEARSLAISAANYVEAGIVIDGARDPIATRELDEVLAGAGVVIEPVTAAQARLARDAYRDFGRGSGHPAKLNFGDCFAYALAKDKDEPLLFKGSDFNLTDVRAAR